MAQEDNPARNVINASEFRTKCLRLLDEVAASSEEIVITKRGKPIARLVPYRNRPESIFGIDREFMRIQGDIVAPLNVEWEAMQDDQSEHE